MDHDVLIDGQPYRLTPRAAGDGVTDDTAAIAAGAEIEPGRRIDGRGRIFAFTPDGVEEIEPLPQRDMFPSVRLERRPQPSVLRALAIHQDIIEEQTATIAALRAVLAPLLDEPFVDWSDGEYARQCRFCLVSESPAWLPQDPHQSGCLVLRRDELLGR